MGLESVCARAAGEAVDTIAKLAQVERQLDRLGAGAACIAFGDSGKAMRPGARIPQRCGLHDRARKPVADRFCLAVAHADAQGVAAVADHFEDGHAAPLAGAFRADDVEAVEDIGAIAGVGERLHS